MEQGARPMPRTSTRRILPILGVFLVAAIVGGLAPARTEAATPFTRDLYFSAGYERQVDGRTCTAASTAMMLNFVARRDLGLNQLSILSYEQPRDALNNSTQRGSDPLGWSRALTYYSSRAGTRFTYLWEAYATEGQAIKRAAKQLAVTGRPVGITTLNGQHAVVMTGFQSTADPRTSDFTVTYVWFSDPIGAQHTRYTASGSPLDKYLELDATTTYDQAWYGKYVIVVPQGWSTVIPTGSVVVTR
jgi:hypothetical protein